MKKIYRPLLKGTNWALAGLISFLGLGISCDSIIKDSPSEYGSPHADFRVKGKVTDEAGTPIPGIRMHAQPSPQYYGRTDTTYTDENGNYELQSVIIGHEHIDVYAEDIDGVNNGMFQPDSARILSKDIDLKDGKGWYEGWDEKEIDFRLKEEVKETEQP